jgi:hypothetical protein
MSVELSPIAERNFLALESELQTLSKRLRFAAGHFQTNAETERRQAVRVALYALSDFVGNVFSREQELRLPLNELFYGLHDLDRGQVVGVLKPTKVKHRAKRSLTAGILRAGGAALMDIYQQGGVARDEAARKAAIMLNGVGYRDERGQRITGKTVEHWRDDLKSRPRESADDVRRYTAILGFWKVGRPSEVESVAQSLLDALPAWVAPTIPKNPTS